MFIVNTNGYGTTVHLVGYRGITKDYYLSANSFEEVERGWAIQPPVAGVTILDEAPESHDVGLSSVTVETIGFGSVKVSGYDDVSAEEARDALTLIAGENVLLSTDAGAKEVTITALLSGDSGFAGDVVSDTVSSAVGEVVIFKDTSGKVIGRGTGSGIAKLTSGVLDVASVGSDYLAPNGSAAALTDFPTLNQNTSGTAAGLSGTPALPNGTTATTQSGGDGSTKVATTNYVDSAVADATYDNRYYTETEMNTFLAGKRNRHGVDSDSIGTIAFDNNTHIFSVSQITYYYNGTGFSSDTPITKTITSIANNTLYYLYFDNSGGTLKSDTTPWDLYTVVPVATVFWNGAEGAIIRENHSYKRNLSWHVNMHLTVGTKYQSGLGMTSPSEGTPNAIQIESGIIYDEDLLSQISQSTNCRMWRKTNATTFTYENLTLPYPGTSGNPQYLDTDTYALTAVGATKYVNVWFYATPDIGRSIYAVPSHLSVPHTNVAEARAEYPPPLGGYNMNPELKLIWKVTYKGDGTFIERQDYREVITRPSGGISTVPAISIPFQSTGSLGSSTVQGAIEELLSETAPTGHGGWYLVGLNQAQASAAQNTWYTISSASIVAMPLSGVTQASGALTVGTTGTYVVTYSIDVACNANAKLLWGGVAVEGVVQAGGQAGFTSTTNLVQNVAGTVILSLSATNVVTLTFRTTSTGTPTITVADASCTIRRLA